MRSGAPNPWLSAAEEVAALLAPVQRFLARSSIGDGA